MLYGIYKEQLVHVDQIDNGLNCNCTCPACGEKLVARNKGKMREHHFAHYFGADCSTGYETSLHILAKNILLKEKRILLPGYKVLGFTIVEEKTYECEDVILEMRMSSMIPDVYIKTTDGERIFIEIKVTHGVDEDKIKKIEFYDTSTIEIDLSDIEQSIDENLLSNLLVNKSELKRWVYHKAGNDFYNKVNSKSKIKPVLIRGLASHVDDCPIKKRNYHGKSYANLVDDCFDCKYLIEAFDDEKYSPSDHSPNAIKCFGHLKSNNYRDIDIINDQNIEDNSKEIKSKIINFTYYTLVQLWYNNNEKPFRAVNRNGFQVQINRNPYPDIKNYGSIEAEMFKTNGVSIGVRTVFGADDFDWKFIN